MNQNTSYEIICTYMPTAIRQLMESVIERQRAITNEIRIRVGQPIAFVSADNVKYLCKDGSLSRYANSGGIRNIEKSEINNIVAALCRYSVHSCTRELSQAYFSIENGIRVGLAGTFSSAENGTLKYITSLNFRIARQVKGCAEELYRKIFADSPVSVLICGGVNTGKTTILRDLCRLCGGRFKTVLVDERSEIAAVYGGIPTLDVGMQTDVLSGCKRSDGIISAVRTLSPDIIFCDEISTDGDADAILSGFGCGVKFAASIHAGSLRELSCRNIADKLLKSNVFDYAVMLEGREHPGKIREIRRLGENA